MSRIDFNDRILAIQGEIDRLREEMLSRISSQYKLIYATILGMAGIFALRENLKLEDYFPFMVFYSMAVIVYMLVNQNSVYYLSLLIVEDEIRINSLADERLLRHETKAWERRLRKFHYKPCSIILTVLFVSILFWYLLLLNAWGSVLADKSIRWSFLFLSGLANLIGARQVFVFHKHLQSARKLIPPQA